MTHRKALRVGKIVWPGSNHRRGLLALINIEREQQIFDFGIRAFSSRKLTHGGEEILENKGRSTQRL
jgi:hypothetical protein